MRTWTLRDGLAVALFILAVMLMTYPVALQLGEGLPSTGHDIYNSLWQKWWLVKVVTEGHDPNYTSYLFYPEGLDITFQPRRWAAFGTWIPLTFLFGDIVGYNLNVLLGLFASAYVTYLLILYLTENRPAAWIGGAFYAFYPQHVKRALGQPNTGSVQWIPLFILVLIVALQKLSENWNNSSQTSHSRTLPTLFLVALVWALNAYISIKVWMLASLLGALYVGLAALSEGWWKLPAFWGAMFIILTFTVLLVMPIAYPFLQSGRVEGALETFTPTGADLYSLVIPAPGRPPLTPPYVAKLLGMPSDTEWDDGIFHVGLASMILVIIGAATYTRQKSRRLVWLVMAGVMWSLTLGVVLRINGVERPEIWTPYRLVQDVILFQAIRQPKRFALAFALPWAVLISYGVAQVGKWLEGHKCLARVALAGLAALMLYEIGEMPWYIKPLHISPFHYQVLAQADPGAIIDLPMGRYDAKRYDFLQTIHGRPIVEGVVARMPEEAYRYINDNPLLLAWRQGKLPTCNYDVAQAADDLYSDGFRYILVHHGVVHSKAELEWLTPYFVNLTPIYEDQYLTVYTVGDLRTFPPCEVD